MIFLRHPVTEAAPGLCYGRTDLGLGPGAGAQIAAAVAACPEGPVVSSPARRCRALAEPLAARTGGAVDYDARLWEMDFGAWEGLRWDAIPRAQSDPWAADYWNIAPPGGEAFSDVCARVGQVLDELAPGTLIVSHAGVIRAAMILRHGATLDEVWDVAVPFATPMRVERRAA